MNTLELVEQQLGIDGFASKGLYEKYGSWWAARWLLRLIYRERHRSDLIADASFDLRELPFTQAARNVLWRADIGQEQVGLWTHLFDKNSQYLAACKSVYMGVGDPYLETSNFFPLNKSGIYQVSWNVGTSVFDGRYFPYIIEPGQEWVTKDVLMFAIKHGYEVQIHKAWLFAKHERLCEEWAARLWNARKALKGIDEDAAGIVNEIAHVGPGAFATSASTHPGIDLIHPNWWADTVGQARVALLANLLRYGPSVCIRTDGLYYLTRESNIRQAVPGILDREGECGGYKVPTGWRSFQVTQDMIDQTQGIGHAELSTLFKQYGGLR